jgi:hypothetical protein
MTFYIIYDRIIDNKPCLTSSLGILKLESVRKNKHFLGKDGKKKGKTRIAIELNHEIAD